MATVGSFITVQEHWENFLATDIPHDAPEMQVKCMKQAFAAGAISGVSLALIAFVSPDKRGALAKHIKDIHALIFPDQEIP